MSDFFPTTVLVGVDGTAESRRAVEVAAELCRATSSSLHLVHVRLREPTARQQPAGPSDHGQDAGEGRALLAAEVEIVEALGATVAGTHLHYGDRVVEGFLRVQEEIGAGLLVMGEPSPGRIGRVLASGTPVQATVRRAKGSVLVVRDP